MKIDEIVSEGVFDFVRGYFNPKGGWTPKVQGSRQDYIDRENANLQNLGKSVDNLAIDPNHEIFNIPTRQAIDKAMGRPYDPKYWEDKAKQYQNQHQPTPKDPNSIKYGDTLMGLTPDDPSYDTLFKNLSKKQGQNSPPSA